MGRFKRLTAVGIALLLLAGCSGSSVYSLPTGIDHDLRIVQGADPNAVLASSTNKGHITMRLGQTLAISTIYRFRSAFADKEKDEYVSTMAVYSWLEPVNDKLSIAGSTITAHKVGLDTLKASYYNNDEGLWVDCKLEITVEP